MAKGTGGGGGRGGRTQQSMTISSGGRSVRVNRGDILNMYLSGGASRRGVITDFDPERGLVYVRSGRGASRAAETNPHAQPHRASGWYKPTISGSGNVYVSARNQVE